MKAKRPLTRLNEMDLYPKWNATSFTND